MALRGKNIHGENRSTAYKSRDMNERLTPEQAQVIRDLATFASSNERDRAEISRLQGLLDQRDIGTALQRTLEQQKKSKQEAIGERHNEMREHIADIWEQATSEQKAIIQKRLGLPAPTEGGANRNDEDTESEEDTLGAA